MRKFWLTTVTAALFAASVAATSANANPAGMTMSGRWQEKASTRANIPHAMRSQAALPTAEISPWRNPVKYLTAAVSEMPIGKKKGSTANTVMPPVPASDSIALDKPTGVPTPALLISMAQMCERQGDVQQARQHYQQALKMQPGHVDALRAAARMEDRLGDLPLAESLYQQAATANPQHAGALNDLGLCLARQGKLDQSVQVIEQAIQLQPEKPLYRNNAATVLVEMRQDQRALAHLAAVHNSAEANYNFGQLLVQRGRSTEAAPYFLAAVEQNPEMQAAHVALSQLQGTGVAMPETTAAAPSVAVPAAPAVGQDAAPQQAPVVGPQFGYPATARSPAAGASSYSPPTYQAPASPYVPTVVPRVGSLPRYLPRVANQPETGVIPR